MAFLNRNQFKTLYGERVYIIAKKFEKLYQKQTIIDTQTIFLRCKEINVIPIGLNLKHNTNIHKNHTLIRNTSAKLRNNLIEHKHKLLRINTVNIKMQLNILYIYLQQMQPNRNHELDLKWINKHDKNR